MNMRQLLSRGLFVFVVVQGISSTGCSLSVLGALGALDEPPTGLEVDGLTDACHANGTFSFSGTRPENTRIIALVKKDGGATKEKELVPLGPEPAFEGELTLEDGVYEVKLVAENGAGVRSKPTESATFTVDGTVPAAPSGELPTEAVTGVDLVLALTTDADAATLNCEAGAVGPAGDVAGVLGAAGVFSVTLPIANGANNFSCAATDGCGNTSAPTAFVVTGSVDVVTAPVVTTPPVNARLDGGTTATITAAGTSEADTTVQLSVDGGAETALTTTGTDPLQWTLSVDLAAGSHTLSLVAERGATRSSATVLNVAVGAALPAPTATCSTGPTKATSLALSGTRTANTSVQAVVDGEDPVQIAATSASTNWSGNYDISARADGSLTYALQAVDAVGGGDLGDPCSVVIDRTAPDAPAVDDVVAVIPIGQSSGPITFTGTGEIGAHVFASLDGGQSTERTTVDANGDFTFDLTIGTAGNPHSVVVKLTDAAGNTSANTTVPVTVRNALVRPNLTTPANGAFPLTTNASQVTLIGTRPATVGVLARFDDGSPDLELVANGTSGTTFNVPIPVPANDSISFCLYAFDASTESDPRCTTSGAPYVITNDSIPPSDLVVDIPGFVLTDTVDADVTKDANASVQVKVNAGAYTTRVALGTAATSVVVTGIALNLGSNTVCFKSGDAAGNFSGEDCFDVTRSAPGITLVSPAEGDLFNGNIIPVEATLLDTTATSYSVCTSIDGGPPSCQDLAASGTLQQDVDIGTSPDPWTVVNVEVCGTDGIITACDNRNIIRWGAPDRLSIGSDSIQAKATPAMAVDPFGQVHLVWQDVSNVCSTGHLDVISTVSRNGSNQLQITVSRPTELDLGVGDGFSVFGTLGFNGHYTVGSLSNGVVTTTETLATGASETSGNVVSDAIKPDCAAPDIFYARFDEAGWSDAINLSDVGGDAASSAPAIVADAAGDVHVVWQENGNLNPNNGSAQPPSAPCDGIKTDLVHRVIDGVTGAISLPRVVSTQDDLVPPTSFVDDKTPSLSAGAGVVVAAWETVGAANARAVLLSRFNGSVWSTPAIVVSHTSATVMNPSVAIGPSGIAYVAWVDNTARAIVGGSVGSGGDRDIVLCPLAPGDANCQIDAEILVSTDDNGAGNSAEPFLAVDEGSAGANDDESVHIVWSDDEGRGSSFKHILHRRMGLQLTGGDVFGPTTSITDSGNGQNPAMAVIPGSTDIMVVWTDNSGTHGEYTALTSIGTGVNGDADQFPEACAFDAPTLVFEGVGSFASADTAPTIALRDDGFAFIAFSHQPSAVAVDSEIFGWGYLY